MIILHDKNGNKMPITDYEDFYVKHCLDGRDKMSFCLNTNHELYPELYEDAKLEANCNEWLIKKIDDDKIDCELNFDFLKTVVRKGYDSGSCLLETILQRHLPTGWSFDGANQSSIRRTIKFDYCTDYDILYQCMKTFGVYFVWDIPNKTVYVKVPELMQSTGEYLTSELNLKTLSFKGDTTKLVTRLYAYGKEGLSIADAVVDGSRYGLEYVENKSYADKTVCAYWSDDRYTVPENLYEDAVEKLNTLAKPVRSYECSVIDLAKQNDEYSFLDFKIHKKVTLIDVDRGIRVEHQIVEYIEYPDEPERNKVTLSCVPETITSTINSAISLINNDGFNERLDYLDAKILLSTAMMTGAFGGHFIQGTGEYEGELFIADNENLSLAETVWRWNINGIAKSSNGVSGPYTTSLTFNDELITDIINSRVLNADLITTGHLSADVINTGLLSSGSVSSNFSCFNLNTGEIYVQNPTDRFSLFPHAGLAFMYDYSNNHQFEDMSKFVGNIGVDSYGVTISNYAVPAIHFNKNLSGNDLGFEIIADNHYVGTPANPTPDNVDIIARFCGNGDAKICRTLITNFGDGSTYASVKHTRTYGSNQNKTLTLGCDIINYGNSNVPAASLELSDNGTTDSKINVFKSYGEACICIQGYSRKNNSVQSSNLLELGEHLYWNGSSIDGNISSLFSSVNSLSSIVTPLPQKVDMNTSNINALSDSLSDALIDINNLSGITGTDMVNRETHYTTLDRHDTHLTAYWDLFRSSHGGIKVGYGSSKTWLHFGYLNSDKDGLSSTYGNITCTTTGIFAFNKNNSDETKAAIYASSFNTSSTENSKKNISLTETDALSLLENSAIYNFDYIDDEDEEITENITPISIGDNGSGNGEGEGCESTTGEEDEEALGSNFGFVIGRETPEEVISEDGTAVNLYSFTSLTWLACQQLLDRIKALEARVDELENPTS